MGAAAIAPLGVALPVAAMGAVFAVWMLFGPTWDAIVVGRRIRIVPDGLQSRVESVGSLVSLGGAALGPLIGGVLATQLGGRAAFLCIALWTAGLAVAAAVARFDVGADDR